MMQLPPAPIRPISVGDLVLLMLWDSDVGDWRTGNVLSVVVEILDSHTVMLLREGQLVSAPIVLLRCALNSEEG